VLLFAAAQAYGSDPGHDSDDESLAKGGAAAKPEKGTAAAASSSPRKAVASKGGSLPDAAIEELVEAEMARLSIKQ
jgi:hypothetical protein